MFAPTRLVRNDPRARSALGSHLLPGEAQAILGLLMITVPIGIYVFCAKARSEKLGRLIEEIEAAEAREREAGFCPTCHRPMDE